MAYSIKKRTTENIYALKFLENVMNGINGGGFPQTYNQKGTEQIVQN